ncbi:2-succinyl-6-hydroxy-2,4-cyclohexadiene-1-carboxylate synthase [Ornithinibacillus bavariensis]|uniref:Putative 2-succinyl-6-hydroxy-2,4-cyclohexadiene-1-carboxylate synthase n=1 Tax=Ornithinibacillus bavariensis TaxID=545502 RepID=A0A920C8E0_9BACI|nr:2-succinyl-6-hydroxy-2,4-cyclohexadiene-1-carboxylate synthase [Ornithinibacillus bavariensis]GIO28603.1 putative 2-succinyl-6-hydroxy-2,4-cyclohexadiene-1-carboxylate synthase [Ornithinibacillus bavariensis]HAM79325.1 2-succinyl-6-hydroxy-2,4-cyclohexadiene-1-carboxylate synthase [Ornithinibacillus sp.]
MRTLIRDVSYWYEIHGNGEPIVLLHGFTGSTHTWDQFLEKHQKQFTILVIDLPGHGKTFASSSVDMESCCHDIHRIVTENGFDQFHLVGYSMGGRTALSYAMFYPQALKSLTLESASPGLATIEERKKRIDQDENLASMLEEKGLESFVKYWENIPLFLSQRDLAENVRKELRRERMSQSVEGLVMSLRSMGTGSQPSWWYTLSALTVPVLLIVGELDHKFISINEKMDKLLPNSKMTLVNNAGHAIHVEQPELFGKIVEEFILADKKV